MFLLHLFGAPVILLTHLEHALHLMRHGFMCTHLRGVPWRHSWACTPSTIGR